MDRIKYVSVQIIDNWFTNLVDTINYDLGQIEDQVPALADLLTTIDTVPIQYFREELRKLVDNINTNIDDINARLDSIESKLSSIQGGI
jgi:predicted  nucleic acid-binding Zn-ribbon protein